MARRAATKISAKATPLPNKKVKYKQHLIERDTLHFIWDNKILFQANLSPSNSAFLPGSTIPVQQIGSLSSSSPLPLDLALWHRRLCHQHLAGVKKLLSGNLVTGFRLDSQADPVVYTLLFYCAKAST